MLLWFVVLYLMVSIGIGLYAATRVHNAKDFAVAGRHLPTPVVVATVRDDEADIIRLLDAGADDYVTKPFSGEHLDARVRAGQCRPRLHSRHDLPVVLLSTRPV